MPGVNFMGTAGNEGKGIVKADGFYIGDTPIGGGDLGYITGVTPGTATASKAVILDANKNIDTITVTSLKLGSGAGTAVTATAAELNILDGVTATAAQLNILSAVTATAAQLNALTGTVTATTTFDPASLAAGAGTTSSAVTVTGAALGDYVLVSAPYDLAGIMATAYVTAANTVKITLHNTTGAAVDLASGTWKIRVLKG